jgi:di/tricarboxylate transporter
MAERNRKSLSAPVKNSALLLLGLAVFAAILLVAPAGLSRDGTLCLALSMTAVVWWATGAIPPGFTALALLAGFVLLIDPALGGSALVFGFWTTPTLYLALGGYMIAHAVEECGLGRRIAVLFVEKFVGSYRGCIISCYVLNFMLSILIPQPWPRSFLILSVMRHIIAQTGVDGKYAAQIGLAAFASSVPVSMILMTGDSVLNALVGTMAGAELSFGSWLLYMGPLGVVASILTCAIQLWLAGTPPSFQIDREKAAREANQLGKLTAAEIKVLVVLLATVALWMTDTLTGLHPGWVALLSVAVMSTPFVGALGNNGWKKVPLSTLMFVTAAVALGAVGGATGMNAWLANILLPSGGGSGMFAFVAVTVGFCVLMHMLLGSTMTAMGVVGSAAVAYGARAGVPALVCAMLVYCAVALHWMLPFHHMSLMVGAGEEGGGYTAAQTARMGAAQILTVAAVSICGIFWWKALGLL